MLRHTLRPSFGPVLVILLAAAQAGPFAAQAEGLKVSIGLSAGATTSPLDDDKTEAVAIPDFRIEGERFSFGLSGLTYDLYSSDALTLSARLAPRFVGADPSKVAGQERLKRDTAVEAGLAASLNAGQFEFGIEALKDVSDTHDGMAVTASVGTMVTLSDRFTIGARAGATWMDRKLATYSYGVLPSEAGGGLSAYSVKASVIPSIGIEANYAMTEKTWLVGGISAEFLPDSVTASPIVKRDTVVSAMIGLRYAF